LKNIDKVPFLILLFIIFLRLPSILEPLENDSGATAYHARLILRGDPLYGTHHSGHHIPGVYYSYVVSFLLFGDQAAAPKWLLIPWTMVTAWILYQIGVSISGRLAGFLAAIFYSVISSHILMAGMTAEAELFANLPITAAVALGLGLSQKPERVRAWFWVGGLCAAAVLYKVTFVAPVGVGWVLIFTMALWGSDRDRRWHLALSRLTWLALGFFVPLSIVGAYFASQGLLERFLMIFTLGFTYTREISAEAGVDLPLYILFPILVLALHNIAALILASFHAVRQGFRLLKGDAKQRILSAGLLAWILLSLAQAGLTPVGFVHYVLLSTPPVGLMAALEIDTLKRMWFQPAQRSARVFFTVLVMSTVLVNSALVNGAVYRDYAAYALGRITYDEYLVGHQGTGTIHLKMSQVADYIRSRTDPEAKIYYWGNAVQLYYLLDRRCASENIWPYYAGAFESVEDLFGPQTPYMVVERSAFYDPPPWVDEYLVDAYILETTIDDHEIYHFIEK
jgi:hypothetical protein